MSEYKIYLSGGITALSMDEQLKWRNKIENAIKFGDYDYRKSPVFFNPPLYYNFEEKDYKSEREVFEFDVVNLRTSDLVIVNFNNPNSIGTAMELMLAKELHIPVIGICKDVTVLHPWLIECCTRICDDLREAVEHITSFYLS